MRRVHLASFPRTSWRCPLIFALLSGLYGCGAAASPPPSANGSEAGSARLPLRVAVSASGFGARLTEELPPEVVELARQERPRTITPEFVAMAGEAEGPRVFWVGYVVGPFIELRARAEEEGRLEAFEDELDSRRAACEEAADVLDCEYCTSDCWQSVPGGMADVTRSLIVVRVSWPPERQPVLDGEQLLWTGTLTDTPFATVHAVEDIDRDGRPELTIDVETRTDWPAGDGGSTERMRHYVDGDTLAVQLSLLESYEEDGHGGGFVQRTEVTRHDANQDGVDDFHVHFVREVFLRDCESGPDEEDDSEAEGEGEDGEPEASTAPECEPLDQHFDALYWSAGDEWRLPRGQRWPWE